MSKIQHAWRSRTILGVGCLLVLAGCDHFDVREAASTLPPYQRALDRPKNIIDAALDHCADKTEERETTCIKQTLADHRTAVADLSAMVPGCRLGRMCTYRYTTEDRLGYVPAMAEYFVAHWSVTFDLRKAGKTAADVPITVDER